MLQARRRPQFLRGRTTPDFSRYASRSVGDEVVIVGPVPGIAPKSVPIDVPRTIGQNARLSSARVGSMSRTPIDALPLTLSGSRCAGIR